jgi:hypothetical protein
MVLRLIFSHIFLFLLLSPTARGARFEILKRTVICHWSFVIGEKNNIQKPPLIGRGCQPPAPWTPRKSFLLLKRDAQHALQGLGA